MTYTVAKKWRKREVLNSRRTVTTVVKEMA